MLNFENIDKFTFPGVGKYDIPQIEPVKAYPTGEFIPVNYHYAAKDTKIKIVHFFVDDYQFIRYWNTPDKYIPKLSQFEAVCAPDFSTYTDMPLPVCRQPLPQALVGGILAAPRHDGLPNDLMERRAEL